MGGSQTGGTLTDDDDVYYSNANANELGTKASDHGTTGLEGGRDISFHLTTQSKMKLITLLQGLTVLPKS